MVEIIIIAIAIILIILLLLVRIIVFFNIRILIINPIRIIISLIITLGWCRELRNQQQIEITCSAGAATDPL